MRHRYIPLSQKRKILHITNTYPMVTSISCANPTAVLLKCSLLLNYWTYVHWSRPSHFSHSHGGGGGHGKRLCVTIYITNGPQKNSSLKGLLGLPAQGRWLPSGPTIWLPFLMAVKSWSVKSYGSYFCIYSYEVEAVWCCCLMVGFDCITWVNNVKGKLQNSFPQKRLSTKKCIYMCLTVCY